ncbi:hypothetical protein [Enterocloster clostridioformis]|uniref:hypothetical protein n=1 Tax=Enterocloster clostridioformis TaxID=1531 RepID=UPI004062DEF2
MADLGKIAVTDGGNYSASTTYEKLTFVHYQGDTYMTLKTVKGVTPTDDGVNYKLFCKSAELATASKAGIVMPDGETTTVNSSGKMSAKQATQSTTGIVKGSKSIKVVSDGAVVVNTNFTQAEDLANIIAEEAIATILGKVSKAIATTMNLNQNALLKSMLTSIDVNDSSKIPTAAYIHTLVERIGMGTQLTAGDNLTEAANNLSSNLASIGTGTQLATLSMINKSITGISFNGYKTIEIMVIIQQASNGNMFFNFTLVPLVSHILDGSQYITIPGKSYGYCANVLLSINYSAGTITLIDAEANEGFGLNAIYILGLK